jgi:hypothetical protein
MGISATHIASAIAAAFRIVHSSLRHPQHYTVYAREKKARIREQHVNKKPPDTLPTAAKACYRLPL